MAMASVKKPMASSKLPDENAALPLACKEQCVLDHGSSGTFHKVLIKYRREWLRWAMILSPG
jgi:hypothetical protein